MAIEAHLKNYWVEPLDPSVIEGLATGFE